MGQAGTILLFGFLAGIDNFQAACALGLLPLSRGRKWAAAASFGLCESVMAMAGLVAGSLLRTRVTGASDAAGTVALLLSGVTLIWLAVHERDLDRAANSRWIVVGLPLSLSLDNLVAGAGLGASGFPVLLCAGMVGVICAAMSLAGLFLGAWGRGLAPRRAGALAGVWLVALALRSLAK